LALAPEPAERDPPAQAPEWPANAVIPLTYHPALQIQPSCAQNPRVHALYPA